MLKFLPFTSFSVGEYFESLLVILFVAETSDDRYVFSVTFFQQQFVRQTVMTQIDYQAAAVESIIHNRMGVKSFHEHQVEPRIHSFRCFYESFIQYWRNHRNIVNPESRC